MKRYLVHNDFPDEKERLRERALAYIDLRMYKEAIVEWEKIIKLDSQNPNSYLDLVFTFEEKGELDKSIECCRNALKLFPDNPNLYANLGFYFRKHLRRPDMALVCYEKALEFDPQNYLALNNIATILSKAGRLQEALVYLKKSMDAIYRSGVRPPSYYRIEQNLAWCYYRCGDYENALKIYSKLSKEYPDEISVCTDFACVYSRLGRFEEALYLLDGMLYQYPANRHCRRLYKLISKQTR